MVEDMVGQRGSLHNSQEVERARGLGETYPPFTHPAIICVTSHLVFLSVGVCQWICPLVKYVYHPITFNDWIHLLWGPNIQHMSPSWTLHIQTFSLPPPIQGWWVLLVPKRVVQGGYPVYFWGSHQVFLQGDDLLSSFWACIWLTALSCLPFLKTAPTENILPPKSTTHLQEAVYHDGVVDTG